MEVFPLISLLITLAAAFSYVNHRYLKMPPTVGLMFLSLILSLGLIVLSRVQPEFLGRARDLVQELDFHETLLGGMLSLLLFAGALHVNLNDLLDRKWEIGLFATAGTVAATFLVGTLAYFVLGWLGFEIPYLYGLVFGALIAPTDPIAVLAILKKAGAPKSLEAIITGESLFNDGIGVVLFLALLGLATGQSEPGAGSIGLLLLEEGLGGIVFGLALGFVAFWLLKQVDSYDVEVMITLAAATGGYALAQALHTSGPLAMVVAGLMVGNHGRKFAMSEKTRQHLDTFWILVDEILNAVLFVLIGFEVLIVTLSGRYLLAGLLMVPLVLGSRLLAVGLPVGLMRRGGRAFSQHTIKIMTWGGLRGGISVALALGLPPGPERGLFLTVTYIVVAFSILGQGLTMQRLIKTCLPNCDPES